MFGLFKRSRLHRHLVPVAIPATTTATSGDGAAILARSRLVPVDCPAWDCTVWIPRWLSVADCQEMLPSVEDCATTIAQTVAFAARDKDGVRLFSNADIPALVKDDAATQIAIANAFNEIHARDGRAEKNS